MNRECVACDNFKLRSHPQHAALGFGRCIAYPVATFVHVERNLPCQYYKPAKPESVVARRVWWKEWKAAGKA